MRKGICLVIGIIAFQLVGCAAPREIIQREVIQPQIIQREVIKEVKEQVKNNRLQRSKLCQIYGHKSDISKYPRCKRCKQFIPLPKKEEKINLLDSVYTKDQQCMIRAFVRIGLTENEIMGFFKPSMTIEELFARIRSDLHEYYIINDKKIDGVFDRVKDYYEIEKRLYKIEKLNEKIYEQPKNLYEIKKIDME